MSKVKKKNNVMTPSELKSWLNGILEFQTKDWVPDKAQWETIRERIFNLAEQESTASGYVARVQGWNPNPNLYQPSYPTEITSEYQSGVEMPAPLVRPEAGAPPPQVLGQPLPKVGPNGVVTAPVKTPNLDTSKSEYKSGFE